jgi:transcriptional regulator with XRE-family HTH domain
MTHIETVRHDLGLSREELADRLGITSDMLGAVEEGEAQEILLYKLAVDHLSLTEAVLRDEPMLASEAVRELAIRIASLMAAKER